MKRYLFCICLFGFMIGGFASAGFCAPGLYLKTVDGDAQPAQGFCRGGKLYVQIGVREIASVAGCAFTLNYPSSLLAPVTTDEGISGDIIDSPAFTFTYSATQTHRENANGLGQILFSAATIAGDGGAKDADPAGDTLLFQVTFQVKDDISVVGNNYTLSITQTELWNPQAGWGTDLNQNGIFDEEDDAELVSPVLVGAVDENDPVFDDLDLAFPTIIENLAAPVTAIFGVTSCEPPVNFTQTYVTGMNLVPFTPTDTGITKASEWVSEIQADNPGVVVNQMLGWNALAQAYVTFIPSMSPPSADFNLVPGSAYFIDVTGPATFQFQGLDYASAELYNGWNLIAVPNARNDLLKASDFLEDIEARSSGGLTVEEIFGWDAANQRYSTSYIKLFGVVDFNLNRNSSGYFVRVTGQGVYEPYR